MMIILLNKRRYTSFGHFCLLYYTIYNYNYNKTEQWLLGQHITSGCNYNIIEYKNVSAKQNRPKSKS